jgi:hypothetical protein
MFEYLSASIGPVVEGLEDYEKIYALEQRQYIPLRTLPGENGDSAITKWELSDTQRKAIADGADILLEVMHFKGPLAPVRMMVAKPEGTMWKEWFCAQAKIRK